MENTAFTITFEDAAKVVNRLGQYEFRLAVSRCGASATLDEIVAAVEAHRKPLMQDAGRNTGSSILMSADAWDKLAKESDAAARRELLKDSHALKSVDELVSKANIAAEAAKRAPGRIRKNLSRVRLYTGED